MAERESTHGHRMAKTLSPEEYREQYLALQRRRENWISPWQLLRENRVEEAFEVFRKNRREITVHGVRVGQALMWTGQYELATRQLEESVGISKKLPMRSESAYAFLGAAHWCLENYVSAFRYWRAGISAPYATGGVCTQTPLLLIAGSILQPGLFSRAKAEDILRSKLSDPRAGTRTEHWPASLGKFVLGTVPKEAMAAWWVRTTRLYEVVMERDRPWLTAFYEAVLDLGAGRLTRTEFRRFMRQRTDQSIFKDWELDPWEHLMLVPEFYIARFEGSQATD